MGNIRHMPTPERPMAVFTLATNKAYTGKNGEAVIETTWHDVVAFEGRNISKLSEITKGSKVYVSGRIRNQKYTGSDGIERSRDEVLAARLLKIDDSEPLSYEM